MVHLGYLLDKLQEMGILAEHENVQTDAASSAFLKF